MKVPTLATLAGIVLILMITGMVGCIMTAQGAEQQRSSSSPSSGGFSAPRASPPPAAAPSRPPSPPAAAAPSRPSTPPPAAVATPTPKPPSPPISSGGFSAPSPTSPAKAATSVPISPSAAPKPTAYDTHVNREASSKAYEARQAPAFKDKVGERTYTPQQVHETRRTYYTTVYRDRYVPTYVGGGSYGSFSETFMYAMMWNSIFANSRSHDPDYQRWRRDAEEKARTDDKLRDRLAELDKEVALLKAANTPTNPNYLPTDVPPEVMFREDALTAKTSPLGGWWFVLIGGMVGLSILLIFTVLFATQKKARHA